MIHNKLLIATVDIITEPLTIRLFNRCLNEGIFPNIWKIAHVTPLHKKGSVHGGCSKEKWRHYE